jgi:hypothetical protein
MNTRCWLATGVLISICIGIGVPATVTTARANAAWTCPSLSGCSGQRPRSLECVQRARALHAPGMPIRFRCLTSA